MVLKAGQQRLASVLRAGEGRECDGGNATADLARQRPQLTNEGITVLTGHSDVADHDVRLLFAHGIERFDGIGGPE